MSTDDILISKYGEKPNVGAIIYFTGFTIFSLGIGDYYIDPAYSGYLILSVFSTLQGLFLVIVSVSCKIVKSL